MKLKKIISKLEKEADNIYKYYVLSKQESMEKELHDMIWFHLRKRLQEEGCLKYRKLHFDFSFDIEMSDFELSYESLVIKRRKNKK